MHEHSVIKGWRVNKCDDRHYKSWGNEFRKATIEAMYIIASPGGGIKLGKKVNEEKCLRLIDELSVEFLGGVPEDFMELT